VQRRPSGGTDCVEKRELHRDVLFDETKIPRYSALDKLARSEKLSLAGTLVAWIAVCVIAALVTTKGGFWWAAAIAGLSMGSSQSAGRAMTGYLAPPRQLAEFFGLWTFATRLASIIGPLSFGAITWMTGGNQRIAILSTAVLFVAGLLLLLPIDMQRGRQAALRT
jgi:UMF1 family MFS transporter